MAGMKISRVDKRSVFLFSILSFTTAIALAVEPAIDAFGPFALRSDGTVLTWNDKGSSVILTNVAKLGGCGLFVMQDGTVQQKSGSSISTVSGLDQISEVSCRWSNAHSLAIKHDGSLWAWGSNIYGNLGIDSTSSVTAPVQVPGISNVVKAKAGVWHSVVVTSDGGVWAWGLNDYGQLMDGTRTDRYLPVRATVSNPKTVFAGNRQTYIVQADGSVRTWGWNPDCTLNLPVGETAIDVQSGWSGTYYQNTYVLSSLGNVYSCGSNNNSGQLGNNTTSMSWSLTKILLSDVRQISVGDSYVVALKNDGSILAWGSNSQGEIGDGTTTRRLIPTRASIVPTTGMVPTGGNSRTEDCLFNWAENTYPAYFPSTSTSSVSGEYYYRYYNKTTTFLAVSSVTNHLLLLGPVTNNVTTDLGLSSTWLENAGCN